MGPQILLSWNDKNGGCWFIASFKDDLRVGGDPGGNWGSLSSPFSRKAAQIEATNEFAMRGRCLAALKLEGESSCLSTSSRPNRTLLFYMFALRHARRFSAVVNKATTIDAVQKLEHDYSRLLRVVKKRIDDRKHLISKVLEDFSHFTNILPDGFFLSFQIRSQMKCPPRKI